jgi:5-methylcytosine-specific restriction endonuclease McrA
MTRASTTARGYGWRWQRLAALVLARDRRICHYCGGYATTVDHVVPKARGGSDTWENLVAACRSCNTSKHDRDAPKAQPEAAATILAQFAHEFGGGGAVTRFLEARRLTRAQVFAS